MIRQLILLLGFAISLTGSAAAQSIAVKTNVVSDITTTLNLGIEASLHPRWTLDISGGYNPWTFAENRKWKHWIVQPEARFWTCGKYDGHFFGIHILGGIYNIGNIPNSVCFLGSDFSPLGKHRFEGWFAGAGIAYGYAWILSRHWNLEAEVGIGWAYTRFDKYDCVKCGQLNESNVPHHYIGPTKVAVNLVYVF